MFVVFVLIVSYYNLSLCNMFEAYYSIALQGTTCLIMVSLCFASEFFIRHLAYIYARLFTNALKAENSSPGNLNTRGEYALYRVFFPFFFSVHFNKSSRAFTTPEETNTRRWFKSTRLEMRSYHSQKTLHPDARGYWQPSSSFITSCIL